MIHVMAATGLGGAAMPAPVVGYDAIAMLAEEQHLRVPIIGRQRPAVAEHDGLTFAPVLVIDVDVSSVFFSYGYVRHILFSFLRFLISDCALFPIETKCAVRFHRSKLRSDWRWRRH